MGIITEYNPDLALRNFSQYLQRKRKREECIPENLAVGEIYPFLKSGQRNYWLEGEIPLLETQGSQKLSMPVASIVLLEATHFFHEGAVWTKGKYKVVEIFSENQIRFNGFAKVR